MCSDKVGNNSLYYDITYHTKQFRKLSMH